MVGFEYIFAPGACSGQAIVFSARQLLFMRSRSIRRSELGRDSWESENTWLKSASMLLIAGRDDSFHV